MEEELHYPKDTDYATEYVIEQEVPAQEEEVPVLEQEVQSHAYEATVEEVVEAARPPEPEYTTLVYQDKPEVRIGFSVQQGDSCAHSGGAVLHGDNCDRRGDGGGVLRRGWSPVRGGGGETPGQDQGEIAILLDLLHLLPSEQADSGSSVHGGQTPGPECHGGAEVQGCYH